MCACVYKRVKWRKRKNRKRKWDFKKIINVCKCAGEQSNKIFDMQWRNHAIEWEKRGGVIIYVRMEEQKWLVAEFVQWPASILSET